MTTDPAKTAADEAAAAEAAAAAKAEVKTVDGAHALQINEPVTKADPNADTTTADSLGVSQQQFDKFYDKAKKAYNWEAHAKELSWQMSQKGGQPTEKKTDAPAQAATEAEANAAVAKAGLDMDALTNELVTGGKLSEESLKALEAVGIPRDTAVDYSKFILSEAKKFKNEVETYLGGTQGIATLKDWALRNLTPTEIAKYEEKLSDPNEWRVYADSLKARAGVRQSGQPALGGNAQGGGGGAAQPYETMAEQLADQRNPKYKTDPAFRAQVMRRAAASNYAGGSSRGHNIGV